MMLFQSKITKALRGKCPKRLKINVSISEMLISPIIASSVESSTSDETFI